MAYDYTVLAGTQGALQPPARWTGCSSWPSAGRCRWCSSAEGGGGRPGDTDGAAASGLATPSFKAFAQLAGVAPKIGIVSGRCFAGNASLLGCCDVIIATKDSNIGMGGPAMIEGGGLGVFTPEEIGPIERAGAPTASSTSWPRTRPTPSRIAKQYLSYFQGPLADWTCADQRLLRRIIPENRLRVYDMRELIEHARRRGLVAGAAAGVRARP